MSDTLDNEFDFDFETQPLAELEIDDFSAAREGTFLERQEGAARQRERRAIIRTSDRISYRRCRRMWNWSHSSRGNLQTSSAYAPFWLGSGMHFALEDFHGYERFGPQASNAFIAYLRATEKSGSAIPDDAKELTELACGMLDYYEAWLESREPLNTLIVAGIPQVEVNFHIEIPKEHLIPYCLPQVLDLYDEILYSITLDRVILDSYGRLFCIEYKSAKRFEHMHLDTDPQVGAYMWGMHIKYPEYEIGGMAYQQHKKQLLGSPAFLGSTKRFSTSKRQKTSYALYLGALRGLYGNDLNTFPHENQVFLEYLMSQESEDRDELIKRDYIERNEHQRNAEYQKILQEVGEMLNPDLPLYPNPTRDCSWQCGFTVPCVAKDAGEDWQHHLLNTTMRRDAPSTYWRDYL